MMFQPLHKEALSYSRRALRSLYKTPANFSD
jgi:hypothetical protein